MVKYQDWKMSGKAADVQKQTLKNLKKAWRAIAKDCFKNTRNSLEGKRK